MMLICDVGADVFLFFTVDPPENEPNGALAHDSHIHTPLLNL
jgi:hypothetical protein